LARFARNLCDDDSSRFRFPRNDDHITHESARVVVKRSPFKESLAGWTRDRAVLTVEQYSQILYDLHFREQHVRLVVYPYMLDDREA